MIEDTFAAWPGKFAVEEIGKILRANVGPYGREDGASDRRNVAPVLSKIVSRRDRLPPFADAKVAIYFAGDILALPARRQRFR